MLTRSSRSLHPYPMYQTFTVSAMTTRAQVLPRKMNKFNLSCVQQLNRPSFFGSDLRQCQNARLRMYNIRRPTRRARLPKKVSFSLYCLGPCMLHIGKHKAIRDKHGWRPAPDVSLDRAASREGGARLVGSATTIASQMPSLCPPCRLPQGLA